MISTKKKKVYFNLTPTIIYEPLDVVDELKQYRINNEIQRRADKEKLKEFFLLFFLQNIVIKYM
jgi:hypothetical protein